MGLKSAMPKPVNGHITLFCFCWELCLFHLFILVWTPPDKCWKPWTLCSHRDRVRDENDWHIRVFCPTVNVWAAVGRRIWSFGLVSSKAGSKYFRSWKSPRSLHYTYFLLFYSCQKYRTIPTDDQGIEIVMGKSVNGSSGHHPGWY